MGVGGGLPGRMSRVVAAIGDAAGVDIFRLPLARIPTGSVGRGTALRNLLNLGGFMGCCPTIGRPSVISPAPHSVEHPGDRALDPAVLGPRVLVVAPHPDDESIACGGLIALLAQRGADLHIVIVTDGSASHPNSRSHPPAELARLRIREATTALAILGVGEDRIEFCHLADTQVPARPSPAFDDAVDRATRVLARLRPSTLVIPSPRDVHGDHAATARIWHAAVRRAPASPQVLEYIVWPAADCEPAALPRLVLDIASVLPRKRRAVAAHRSQHGLVVADDPDGFVLPPALLARAGAPAEIFYGATP
jgi:LmbE family N-acetylglucosaminyl deacetylase